MEEDKRQAIAKLKDKGGKTQNNHQLEPAPHPPDPITNQLLPQVTILTRDTSTGANAKAGVRVVEIQGT